MQDLYHQPSDIACKTCQRASCVAEEEASGSLTYAWYLNILFDTAAWVAWNRTPLAFVWRPTCTAWRLVLAWAIRIVTLSNWRKLDPGLLPLRCLAHFCAPLEPRPLPAGQARPRLRPKLLRRLQSRNPTGGWSAPEFNWARGALGADVALSLEAESGLCSWSPGGQSFEHEPREPNTPQLRNMA